MTEDEKEALKEHWLDHVSSRARMPESRGCKGKVKNKIEYVLMVLLCWIFVAGICLLGWAFAEGNKVIWIPLAVFYFIIMSIMGYKYFAESEE